MRKRIKRIKRIKRDTPNTLDNTPNTLVNTPNVLNCLIICLIRLITLAVDVKK